MGSPSIRLTNHLVMVPGVIAQTGDKVELQMVVGYDSNRKALATALAIQWVDKPDNE